MCGIAGFHLKHPDYVKQHEGVERLVDKLLLGIESRGKHATGFVAVTKNGKTVMDKAAVTASDFIKDRDRIPENVQTVLLHTRYATQGPAEDHVNNHPVLFNTCFAVHNGHINNDADVFTELGVARTAEVDSVAIAAMIDSVGFDNLAEGFAKLQGRMATAIIDPIKHPKELVLARGDGSPLVIIENQYFIMWASLQPALKDAWAEVLGTPPAYNKFEHVKEGVILHIKDQEVTRTEFQVPRPFGFQKNSAQRTTQAGFHGKNTGKKNGILGKLREWNGKHNGEGSAAATTAAIGVIEDCKDAIKDYISGAHGKARYMSTVLHYTDEEMKDVSDAIVWLPCPGCARMVLKEDMRTTVNWGRVCLDCNFVIAREVSKKVREEQDADYMDEKLIAGTDVPRMQETDRDALEAWAAREQRLHQATLDEVSKRVGSFYSPGVIEFLCFFADANFKEYSASNAVEVLERLQDMYEETYMGVAEEEYMAGPWNEEMEVVEEVKQLPPGKRETWCYCHDHEQAYKEEDGCIDCIESAMDACGVAVFEEKPGQVIELPKCPKCNTYVLRDPENGQCTVCQIMDKKDAEGKADCAKCGKKANYILTQKSGHKFSYCREHYTTCWTAKCEVMPNHILPDGARCCHKHVRGKSGAVSGTTLIKRGVTIEEVR